jgi:transposase
LAAVPPECRPEKAIADKGYDSAEIRDAIVNEGMVPVIPSRSNALEPLPLDKKEYRERNRVERLVSKLKQFRRIATRYEKLAITYLAMIHITSALIICREFVNRA